MEVPKWWCKSEERIKGVYKEGYKRAWLEIGQDLGVDVMDWDESDDLSAEQSYEEWLKERNAQDV